MAGIESKKAEAQALLSKLSTKQKVRIISGGSMWTLKPIPRLEIPKIWLCDGPHGLRKQHDEWVTDLLFGRETATCFPTASCLACSWDPALLQRVGQALGRECKAHNVSVLLGPGINMIRHARGGRNFEYYSEDPFLTGRMAAALVQGIQSQGVGVSLKHFFANNQEKWRFVVDVIVDQRTQKELYERAFEHVIRTAQPWTIMAAYNQVNGEFCSEHSEYKKIRDEWDYQGLILTDWGATSDRIASIKAGVDLEMPGSVGAWDDYILKAVRNKDLSEDDLDQCALRVLCLMLLSKENLQSSSEDPEAGQVAHLDAHHELAREVAAQSIVLVKNVDRVLPLQSGAKVAVIGAFAKKPRFQGMGSSEVSAYKVDCAWDRIQEYTKDATYAAGYPREHPEEDAALLQEAVSVAKAAEVAVIFCGLTEISESEGFDRDNMELSPGHNSLIQAVAAVNSNTVVVLSNGSAVTLPHASKVNGIVESWLGGQAGASACVDVLFGKSSPCGKLAQSFPHDINDIPCHKWFPGENRQVQYREGLNVGYRYFDSAGTDVLFPFGHGLSYSKFEFRNLKVDTVWATDADVQVELTLEIENTGGVPAAEVVQCYVHDVESSVYRPQHELKGFQKVFLQPLESQEVKLSLGKDAFSFWDTGAQSWVMEAGQFEIQIGSSSRDIRQTHTIRLDSKDEVSLLAKESNPPVALPLATLDDSDARFEAMLGHSIPVADIGTRIHRNSLLQDTLHTKLGRIIKGEAKKKMLSHIKEPNEVQIKFVDAVLDNATMRSFVLFSKGEMSFPLLDLIIHMMNGEYCVALIKIPWVIMVIICQLLFVRKNRV